uniref:Uncharacterized protein n=1 Tax=viral metagenome TaxID=1070528 RepID=A0A6C0D8H4_9ZZZZ
MTDPYYTIKVEGWKHMIDWISSTHISFKDFCKNHKMDYILFSGYLPYMEKMETNGERLRFVNKQINKCETQLNEYMKSKTPPCCLAK